MNRKEFLKTASALPLLSNCAQGTAMRPHVLLLMADNHCAKHPGCYGDPVPKTPNIDSVVKKGVRFTHAFCGTPSCSPERAAVLTRQDIWRLQEAANLWGVSHKEFPLIRKKIESPDPWRSIANCRVWKPNISHRLTRMKF